MKRILLFFLVSLTFLTLVYADINKEMEIAVKFSNEKIVGYQEISDINGKIGDLFLLSDGRQILISGKKIVFISDRGSGFDESVFLRFMEKNRKMILEERDKKTLGESQILPLTKTKWGVCPPFNNKMPVVKGEKASAGHIGVAVAQLMRFWKYPEKGSGSFEYRLRGGEIIRADFNHLYNYDLMPFVLKIYSSLEEIEEISQLIYDTTVAAKTDFYNFSKGENARIIPALTQNFGFSKNMELLKRTDYNDKSWFDIIKSELKEGRIILYNLRCNTNYDHISIVDGYIETNNEKLIHINLGCGGKMNGYYSFNSVWKFTDNAAQFILINIFPAGELPFPIILKSYSTETPFLLFSERFDYLFWDIESSEKDKYSYNVYSYDFEKSQYVFRVNVKSRFTRLKVEKDTKRKYIVKTLFDGKESKSSKEIVFN